MAAHTCFHCGTKRPTAQGIRSHISQAEACRAAFQDHLRRRASVPVPLSTDQITQEEDSSPGYNIAQENNSAAGDYLGSETPTHRRAASDTPIDAERAAKRTRVDNTEDTEAGGLLKRPFVEHPGETLNAGKTLGRGKTLYKAIQEVRKEQGLDETSWAPFEDKEEWALARWLMTSGLSHAEIDKHLKLDIVRTKMILKLLVD